MQLSPQTRERTETRHARYLKGADAVQWIAHDDHPFIPGVLRLRFSPTGESMELVDASPHPITHMERDPIVCALSQWRIGPVCGEGHETTFLTCEALEARHQEDERLLLEQQRQDQAAAEARRIEAELAQQAELFQGKHRGQGNPADEEHEASPQLSQPHGEFSTSKDVEKPVNQRAAAPLPAAWYCQGQTSTGATHMRDWLWIEDEDALPLPAELPPAICRPGSFFGGLPWEGTTSAVWEAAPSKEVRPWWPHVRAALVAQGRIEDYTVPILRNGQPVGQIRRWRLLPLEGSAY